MGIHYVCEVAGQPGINAEEYKTYRFMIPEKEEQQKIAAFLSSVDTKIEQLNQKKSLLKQYKKGMMQKLFSQEIRFKDEQGKEYPDWEEKRLGEIFSTFKSGYGITVNRIAERGDYPVYGGNGIRGYTE